MSKISLIIQREYTSRVKKKSFIVMTILGPLIFASLVFLPGYLATREDTEEKTIAVIDQTEILGDILKGTNYIRFEQVKGVSYESLKANFNHSGYYAILVIPANVLTTEKVALYANQQTTMSVNELIS
ncbi:MAG: ABC transporter permease, partial [Bacteroidales bacterium]|nr:ABC transporter permease [Bacteroidales bacterium]